MADNNSQNLALNESFERVAKVAGASDASLVGKSSLIQAFRWLS